MIEPKPYYATPDGRVRLYHGDCRELLPLIAPASPRVLVLADPPYGTERGGDHRSPEKWPGGKEGRRRSRMNGGRGAPHRTFKPIEGDAQRFDPAPLLPYERALIWGWHHFSDALPLNRSPIIWDKRETYGADDGGDGETAWTNLGGPLRIFRHVWRGTCRASERGVDHLHPTQKPEAFYRWLFAGRGRGKPVVSPGDLIVVPYAGSGPEIRPAMELGLEVVAIELEREYLDTIIKHRIQPALAAGRQIDIWAPKPRREEQLELGGAR